VVRAASAICLRQNNPGKTLTSMTNPPQPPQHAPAAPAPQAYQPLKWSFPFTPTGKDDANDPMTYMKALGNADDGFYPLGANGMWHGGIHFGPDTGKVLKQDGGVRAIADGEVVAYRLDRKYPELEYQDKRFALYSTGFVLIRHKLVLPPAQTSPAPGNAHGTPGSSPSAPAAAPAPGDTLTFFSLYMHVLDWNSYQSAMKQDKTGQPDSTTPHVETMAYWSGDRRFRVGDKAQHKQDMPKPKAPQPPDNVDRDLLKDLIDNGFIPPLPEPDPQTDEPPPPPPVTGLRICDKAKGHTIGLLPKGSELTVTGDAAKTGKGWAQIASIRSGEAVGRVSGTPASRNVQSGWVLVDELEAVVDPSPLDTVVVLKEPYKVKAGDIIGYVGQYLRFQEAKPTPPQPTRPILHLEVFAGPDLPDFIAKSRDRAKSLSDVKPFLEVSTGALLVTDFPDPNQTLDKTHLKLVPVAGDAKTCRWVKVQPKIVTIPHPAPAAPGARRHQPAPIETADGPPLWVDASLANTTTTTAIKGWTAFPLQLANAKGPGADFREVFRRADLDKSGAACNAIDDKGNRWRYISIGTKDGSTREGWVCESDKEPVRICSSWDWPGFEKADGSGLDPIHWFRRHLFENGLLWAGEDETEFRPSAALVNGSELITKLENAIDRDHDGKVTAQELKQAQQTRWTAQAISHLVVRSDSEWGGDFGKWEALTPLMGKLNGLWHSELERIRKLVWWEKATGIEGFPKEPTPWHFHPVGLVGNFVFPNVTVGQSLSEDGLWFIFYHEAKRGVTDRLHWPQGASGVTLGPGYDMKARTEENVAADMRAIGISDTVAAAIAKGVGKTGSAADNFANENRDLIQLSHDQEISLLRHTAKPYEATVRNSIKLPITQNQFDALVSFAYNPAGRWKSVTNFINSKDVDSAMKKIKEGVTSNGTVMKGLVVRRDDEVTLYTEGRYEWNGAPISHK
jgi:GH24 family phage-related lysozyme (muramidase)